MRNKITLQTVTVAGAAPQALLPTLPGAQGWPLNGAKEIVVKLLLDSKVVAIVGEVYVETIPFPRPATPIVAPSTGTNYGPAVNSIPLIFQAPCAGARYAQVWIRAYAAPVTFDEIEVVAR